MIIIPKEHTKCRQCIWATYLSADSILESGYLCKINPFRTVVMGLEGAHCDRKRHIEDEKEERKNKYPPA